MNARRLLMTLAVLVVPPIVGPPVRAAPTKAVCIVPSRAAGGFDLTCKLAVELLRNEVVIEPQYVPGGIGAIAFSSFATKRRAESDSIVAFSSGSLLNLAQGKFGPHNDRDARWLAIVGVDYGVIAVRKDSPLRTLSDLAKVLKEDSAAVTFGAGGTIGSQDWFKAALFSTAAGANYKAMRFVAFEGGGEALAALQGRHVDVVTGDAGETSQLLARNRSLRLLAVLSGERLPGVFADVPTAREQGFDIVWPIARGFYLGPDVPDAAFNAWENLLRQAMARPDYSSAIAKYGLYPLPLTGPDLRLFIDDRMKQYRFLVKEYQLDRSKSQKISRPSTQ